ncbi:putative holin [Pasteurella multocida]|uniref:Holin n=1 Tax=Pasteurella multocida TaxID=747 RepID=A0AAW8V4A8_PASMD|nr:putative holin [Pasteurella multocida]MDH7437839.1 putative holin [Pasteurella multocida]MDH7440506.1 putative holin [Pasteurella multocida]MDT3451246.1 putative holin [Pasteurella multocida]MDY0440159.1 putative holin [Pasteurella multocida]MDY0457480.1 putative holin [Pasteurella multocida]
MKGFFNALKQGRLLSWVVSALVLLIVIVLASPQQVPVVLYKLSLVSIAAIIGYHLDRALFPYASPGGYLKRNWKNKHRLIPRDDNEPEYAVCDGYLLVFALVVLRRAVIVGAVMLGVTLGI